MGHHPEAKANAKAHERSDITGIMRTRVRIVECLREIVRNHILAGLRRRRAAGQHQPAQQRRRKNSHPDHPSVP
jgi:hypothetical protein